MLIGGQPRVARHDSVVKVFSFWIKFRLFLFLFYAKKIPIMIEITKDKIAKGYVFQICLQMTGSKEEISIQHIGVKDIT